LLGIVTKRRVPRSLTSGTSKRWGAKTFQFPKINEILRRGSTLQYVSFGKKGGRQRPRSVGVLPMITTEDFTQQFG